MLRVPSMQSRVDRNMCLMATHSITPYDGSLQQCQMNSNKVHSSRCKRTRMGLLVGCRIKASCPHVGLGLGVVLSVGVFLRGPIPYLLVLGENHGKLRATRSISMIRNLTWHLLVYHGEELSHCRGPNTDGTILMLKTYFS